MKGKSDINEQEESASLAAVDQPLEKHLERLPTQYRTEILKQYEMPETKVSILTIFRYATPVEVVMQVVGILFAFAAGRSYCWLKTELTLWLRRRVTSHYGHNGKYDKFVW